MTRITVHRRIGALLLAAGLLAAGCNLQTLGSPMGGVTVEARFDTVRNLVPGHSVKIADVGVGTVTSIDLSIEDFRATVRMELEPGRQVPVGTEAVIRKTSLLGEHYVELVMPSDFDPTTGPFLADGDAITVTRTLHDLEEVVEAAGDVVAAVSANDITRLIDAAAVGLGGRGEQLNQMIAQLTDVTGSYAAQRDELRQVIDGFAAYASDVRAGLGEVETFLDELDELTQGVAQRREQIVETLRDVTTALGTIREVVLADGIDTFGQSIRDVRPLLEVLAGNTDKIDALLENVLVFAQRARQSIVREQVLISGWLELSGFGPGPLPVAGGDVFDTLSGLVAPAPADASSDRDVPAPPSLGDLGDLIGRTLGGSLGGRS